MAVIQMPARSGGEEMGMIVKWHKKTGDWVAEGDELFSFETDEGTFTVKSQKAGRLVAVFVPEGEIVHCPADVGMLTSPTPDSVLKIGRQQFIDESKPLEAREPAQVTEEAEIAAEEEVVSEEEPEEVALEEEEISEEELLEDAEEAEDFEEAAEEETEAPVSEEELLQYVEEDTDDLEAMEPEVDEEEIGEEAENAEEESAEAAEEGVCEEDIAEEADAIEEIEEAEEAAVVAAKPASVTAQADMTLCIDIAARTGVSLGAMVRFAAMHTGLSEFMEDVEAVGLRALDELQVLPNVRDLSSTGITAVNAACAGGVELMVPAVHDAWRVSNDALEVYPCLNLTLAFDENVLDLEEAAVMLQETCEKLENLIDMLI